MTRNLFFYGTLTFPEIVYALVGKNFKSESAQLKDYSVRKVKRKPFPGLIKQMGETANGLILFDVDDNSFEIITKWEDEDPEFSPKQLKVKIDKAEVDVTAFVWQKPSSTGGLWDRELFQKKYINDYLNIKIPNFLKAVQ